jgi:hypothetical protein
MALLKCKDPNCDGEVNTDLACKKVTALYGLRFMLENQRTQSAISESAEISNQLEFIERELQGLGIQDTEHSFQVYKEYKTQSANFSKQPPPLRRLYIACTKGHRHYYDVDCSC